MSQPPTHLTPFPHLYLFVLKVWSDHKRRRYSHTPTHKMNKERICSRVLHHPISAGSHKTSHLWCRIQDIQTPFASLILVVAPARRQFLALSALYLLHPWHTHTLGTPFITYLTLRTSSASCSSQPCTRPFCTSQKAASLWLAFLPWTCPWSVTSQPSLRTRCVLCC